MLQTRVIPCLLLHNQGLVKTVEFRDPKYIGDPINAVKIFNDKEVDELVFLDITATPEGRRPNFERIEELASECFMPFGYGGGLRNIEDIRTIFSLGVEKVVINSYANEQPNFLQQAANLFGSQSIVLSVDVRRQPDGRHIVYTRSGTHNTGREVVEYSCQMQELGIGEIYLTSIDHDGKMTGFDIPLIRKVTSAVTVPVVACGGAGRLEHFAEAVKSGGASAIAAGSMFVFHGKFRSVLITYPSPDELKKHLF